MPLPEKHLGRLKKSLNRLKLSLAVRSILVDIANELHDIYEDGIEELQKENRRLEKLLERRGVTRAVFDVCCKCEKPHDTDVKVTKCICGGTKFKRNQKSRTMWTWS